MSEPYSVLWAEIAESDLTMIVEYIAANSKSNALQVLKKIKEKTDNLYYQPDRGRIVPELLENGLLQYREIIVKPWRIIYRVSKMDVYILAVIDSRQNVEDVLLYRFIKATR
jgi:plasmid stabilization system protein ParE